MDRTLSTVESSGAPLFDLEGFRAAPLEKHPFPHLLLTDALRPDSKAALFADFPPISEGGSFPLSVLSCGASIARLVRELEAPAFAEAVAEKFEIELTGRPTTITLRGRSREKDGRIHRDSESKLVTVLLYLNDGWSADGGRLRLLRSRENLEDCFLEVPPLFGTLLAFRCTPNGWHGHRPFVGERRSLQLNWVVDEAVARRERRRHGLTALMKSFLAEEQA